MLSRSAGCGGLFKDEQYRLINLCGALLFRGIKRRVCALANMGVNGLPELVDFHDWLDEVITKTGRQCSLTLCGGRHCGNCDDRHALINGLNTPEDLKPVHYRHCDIQQDQGKS